MKLKHIYTIKGKILLLSGLHIGGNKEDIEIGGMDQPIIKNPLNQAPYIPGSSLKGKMRSMMELTFFPENFKKNKTDKQLGDPCKCAEPECMVCRIFGTANNEKPAELGPTRIICRDANFTDFFKKKYESGDLPMEEKHENTIDRIKGTALNPRPLERVPAGVEFDFSLSLKSMENDPDDLIDWIWKGLKMVELDGLGGSISRGSGQIQFIDLSLDGKPLPDDHLNNIKLDGI